MNKSIQIKVPKDRLAISVLSSNPFSSGEEFKKDGYVYLKGNRLRKWFSQKYGSKHPYFWEPVLDQPVRIEKSLYRLRTRMDVCWTKLEKIFKEVQSLQRSDKRGYQLDVPGEKISYSLRADSWFSGETTFSYTIDANTRSKQSKRLQELGRLFYVTERYYDSVIQRWSYLRSMFMDAARADLEKKKRPKHSSETYHYKINGRSYFFRYKATRLGGVELEFLSDRLTDESF